MVARSSTRFKSPEPLETAKELPGDVEKVKPLESEAHDQQKCVSEVTDSVSIIRPSVKFLDLEMPTGTSSSSTANLQRMVSDALDDHPEADTLIPLTLLELADNNSHRLALEVLMPRPQRFKIYVLKLAEKHAMSRITPRSPSADKSTMALWPNLWLADLFGEQTMHTLQARLCMCAGLLSGDNRNHGNRHKSGYRRHTSLAPTTSVE